MKNKIKNQIVEVSKLMYNKGFANAYEGNVSMLDNDLIYITPSSICKGFLNEDMIVVTDSEGNVIEGNFKPSSEIKLHLAAYRSRKDINSVVHAHSPYATAFAVANKPIETKAYTEMMLFFDRIPLADYGTPSTDEIFYGVEKYINYYHIILLANHGVLTTGSDAYEAFFKLESAESIAKTLLLANLLGGEKELPADKIEKLNEIRLRNKKNNLRK